MNGGQLLQLLGGAKGGGGGGPAQPITSALHVQGPGFIDDAGKIVKLHGVAGFLAPFLWLTGQRQQLSDFADWMQSIDANAWLFFCMWRQVPGFDPRNFADFHTQMDALMSWMEGRGFRPYPSLFQDQVNDSPVLMSRSEANNYFNGWRDILQRRMVRFMNETYQNGVDLVRSLPHIDGALCCRGQVEDGAAWDSAGPVLDFQEKSFARKFQWPRTAKDLFEIYDQISKPGVGGEPPCGIFETTIPFSRSNDPRAFAQWHAVAELYGAGSFIHGDDDNLQFCKRPGPGAQACAEAISATWSCGLPIDGLLNGRYTRGGNADCPMVHLDRYDDGSTELNPAGAERTFAVIMNDGHRATCVIVQPGPAWQPEATNGWSISRRYGPHGDFFDLVR